MVAYKHNINNSHRKSRAKRVKRTAQIFSVLLVLVTGFIFVDWLLGRLNDSNTIVSTESVSSVQSASVSVYRTNFFQFQAPEEWVFVSSKSTDEKFVYVKNNGPLVTERFIVFIDRPVIDHESDMSMTNVLPVDIVGGRRLDYGAVSSQCGESVPDTTPGASIRIELDNASFICTRRSKEYNVIFAEKEGNEGLEFYSNSSPPFNMTLVYSNLTAYPNTGDIYKIASSFESL